MTLLSTQAEYIALSACAQEILYLRHLLAEMGFTQMGATVIYEDNQSTIKLVKNPEGHGRTKHIDVRHFFVQEAHARGEILLEYCPTSNQIADIFTKALARPQFQKLRHALGVLSLSEWQNDEQMCQLDQTREA